MVPCHYPICRPGLNICRGTIAEVQWGFMACLAASHHWEHPSFWRKVQELLLKLGECKSEGNTVPTNTFYLPALWALQFQRMWISHQSLTEQSWQRLCGEVSHPFSLQKIVLVDRQCFPLLIKSRTEALRTCTCFLLLHPSLPFAPSQGQQRAEGRVVLPILGTGCALGGHHDVNSWGILFLENRVARKLLEEEVKMNH